MKQLVVLGLSGLLGLGSLTAQACTPEEAIAKGELLAQMIYDRTKDQPGMAEELNIKKVAFATKCCFSFFVFFCYGARSFVKRFN